MIFIIKNSDTIINVVYLSFFIYKNIFDEP